MAAKALFRRINPHYIGHIRGSDRKGFRAIGLGFANDWDDTVSYHIRADGFGHVRRGYRNCFTGGNGETH